MTERRRRPKAGVWAAALISLVKVLPRCPAHAQNSWTPVSFTDSRSSLQKRPTKARCDSSRTSRRALALQDTLEPVFSAPAVGSWALQQLVASYPEAIQQAVVFSIYLTFFAISVFMSQGVLQGLFAFSILYPNGPLLCVARTALALLVASFFVSFGALHFLFPADFAGIVPPYGTWGIWLLPGPAVFHVYWTGVAHIVGGLLLIAAELNDLLEWLVDDWKPWWRPPASEKLSIFLAAQLVAVSPANLYMFTHGVDTLSFLKLTGPIPYPEGHVFIFLGLHAILGVLLALSGIDGDRCRRPVGAAIKLSAFELCFGAFCLYIAFEGAYEFLTSTIDVANGRPLFQTLIMENGFRL